MGAVVEVSTLIQMHRHLPGSHRGKHSRAHGEQALLRIGVRPRGEIPDAEDVVRIDAGRAEYGARGCMVRGQLRLGHGTRGEESERHLGELRRYQRPAGRRQIVHHHRHVVRARGERTQRIGKDKGLDVAIIGRVLLHIEAQR